MVVEDSLDIRRLLVKILELNNYEVSCAENGRVALDMLQVEENLPDLILLDLMMPEMDGYEFRVEQVRSSKLSAIPIVVMTAEGGSQVKIKNLAAQAFLKKPFDSIDAVLDTVEHFFTSAEA